MTGEVLTKLGRLCREIAGHARAFARQTAADATEALRDRLPWYRKVIDIYELQVFLGDELQAMYAETAALDDRFAGEVERGRHLRRLRERLTAELRGELSRVKKTLAGAYDAATSDRILRHVRRLQPGAAALSEQAGRFHAALVDPALQLPPPAPWVEIDPAALAGSFEEPMDRLDEALAELADSECRLRRARSRKDAALKRLQGFAEEVASFYMSVYRIARHERTSGKSSAHSPPVATAEP